MGDMQRRKYCPVSIAEAMAGDADKFAYVDLARQADVALGGGIYVPRNADLAAWDFTLADLTTDGTWRELDLSAILPAGAIWVKILASMSDNVINSQLAIRRNGNANGFEVDSRRTQVANQLRQGIMECACDDARVIEYYATNVVWTAINLYVVGWFI